MKTTVLAFATAAGVMIASATAQATPVTGFGDPLSDPALSGGAQQGFDSVAPGLYTSLALGNVTYSSSAEPFTIGANFNGIFNTTGGQSLFNDFDYLPKSFRFDFATAVSAFGFNFGASDNSWTLSAFDAGGSLLDSLLIAPVLFSNVGDYFGIAATGISYAILTDTSDVFGPLVADYVFVDRFTTSGAVSPVPLPGALPLLAAGLAALGWAGRRRRA